MSKKPVKWRAKMVPKPHAFTRKILHWPYCCQCGLIRLSSDVCRRAAQEACEVD